MKWVHEEGKVELATFGGGSFWGVQRFFTTKFKEKYPDLLDGILDTYVGFMSPYKVSIENPTHQ